MHAVFLKLLLLHLFLTFFLQDMDCAMMRQLIANLSLGNLISGHSMWDVWWTKWHWDSFFFLAALVFPLSLSLHLYSILIPSSITDAKKS
jgi:hypothetical protein